MYNKQTNPELILLLPKLKPDCDVKASDRSGQWDRQQTKAFDDVASSLDYEAPGAVKSVSSVPTMWARPLLMEMGLHNQAHPLRQQMIAQWQGMLAAIALAEVRGFPLKAQLVELDKLTHEDFAESLHQLVPDPVHVLYDSNGHKNPWLDIYLFFWNKQSVGMTTPSTLVVPSEEAEWTDLPWWDRKQKTLLSPQAHLNEIEKNLLWLWLDNLRQELRQHNGKKNAINTIGGLVDEFRASLKVNPQQPLTFSPDPQFFDVPLNRGVLKALNYPVKAPERPSGVRLIPSPNKQVKPLLILDTEIAKVWNVAPQNIWVHGGKTLAALPLEDLQTKRLIWQEVYWIESKDLFLPEFVFIDQEEALPGAFSPPETEPLTFNGQRITPLVPLNPILLEYFTPEDLIRKLQFQPLYRNDGSWVRVILDLPLSGLQNGNPPENYRIYKDYPLKEENIFPAVPVLEVWPYFRAQGWQEYYAFYYDAEYKEETFQVRLPRAKEPKIFQDGRGSYQLVRLEEFPSFIMCWDQKLIGLILLRTPDEIQPRGSWRVGVDFGTSFTNIYVNKSPIAEQLRLENLLLQVTEAQKETRLPVLFEYFVPENFIPAEKPLPLSSVLTTRGSTEKREDKLRPVFDGRIYIPDRNRFKPQEDWLKTNLKWSKENLSSNQLFLKHLALHISALAAKNGVETIQWSLSYPSAFSRGDRTRYIKVWQNLTAELQTRTGINHICPDAANADYFRTESLATAQYFRDEEGHDLIRTTCIDMGGGTSDISIWEENTLVHQCSVQLAGRDIFSQFLEMNPQFLERRFEANLSEWRGLKAGAFNAKLDVLLRLEGENWLKNRKPHIEDEADFQGLIRLTAIGTAGLYYYVGIVLKVLNREEKYSTKEITPVYIGGNGSRFLNWLAERGQFDRHSEVNLLLSRMLSQGSGFEDIEVETRLSGNPKDEVACGLVLNETKLQGLQKKAKDPLIAGESCVINGELFDGDSRLDIDPDDGDKDFELKIPQLVMLPQFLYDFHVALRELEIEGITRLDNYNRSPEIDKNKKLWSDVQKELTNLLLSMKGKSENVRLEPPFILGLKALLKVLGKQWSGK
ncbi:MAG: hypothetical protein SAL70_37755 [Scytonema sp. PMC 1070.18]|nr:hypothetical protein [Scytonema sp. PMC 1070.18]